ncbi:MAG TPA: hypothetical protein VGB49_00975 [Caulobacteraceae bacterium]|jgi:hypothetical protein
MELRTIMLAAVLATAAGAAHAQEPAKPDLDGFKLGAGIAVTVDFGGIERISDAELVNGVVRVRDEDDVRAGLMLETHYFFPSSGKLWNVEPGDWGHGPFFAVQPGTEEIIETAALGWMIGFRPKGGTNSFNLGIGVAVDPNTQTLGDGVVRNMPLPVGETQIRYREEAQYGVLILFSRTF